MKPTELTSLEMQVILQAVFVFEHFNGFTLSVADEFTPLDNRKWKSGENKRRAALKSAKEKLYINIRENL